MADMIDIEAEAELRTIEREYLEFLDDDTIAPEYTYAKRIQDMVTESKYRLIVDINDLRKKYPKRIAGLITDGFREVGCLQRAVKTMVDNTDPEYSKQFDEFFVGFEGSFGQRHVNPRTLQSRFLGNMVCCEGIVTKCSLIRPKVVRSVHYCAKTNKTMEKRYTDLTSSNPFPSSSAYPTEDENKNPLETEFGLSSYKDHQSLSIQEMPETAPTGQLPRMIDIIADNDLADACKPGDRVRIIGVYRCLPNKQAGFTTGTFKTVLIANNVQLLAKDAEVLYADKDVEKIREFMKDRANLLNVLTRSLAPSIHGHDEVKLAILCLMLGGMEKILPNGSRLRGDINILLIGDPSVAKSQLLRYVLLTAHRAIATTGRGSSGVGLTAAVTTDQETGERRLEAGAMVLGDRGIVCIDEFDKMTDIDRTAIHEVMEQGRVSISKAGIHAKLNARCSVLAAANPVFGRYDDSKTPMENISMQDSLLSRFDLLFVLLDDHNIDRDSAIAEHVVKLHRFRNPGEADGAILSLGGSLQTLTTKDLDKDDEEDDNYDIYEKDCAWLPNRQDSEKYLTAKFFRKYIELAKHAKPVLTDEAAHFIAQKYADLRSFDEKHSDKEKTMPVTARMLETMIRLSTAFAKTRLAKKVKIEDAEKAFNLVSFACFKEKPEERKEGNEPREGKKRRRHKSGDGDDDNDEDGKQGEEAPPPPKKKKEPKVKSNDPYDFDEDTDGEEEEIVPFRRNLRSSQIQADSEGAIEADTEPIVAVIDVQRYETFKKQIRQIFDEKRADRLPLKDVIDSVQANVVGRRFSKGEIEGALARLGDDNRAMVSDGIMFLI